MPKLPSKRTIIARPPRSDLSAMEQAALGQKHGKVVKKVREVLDNKELMAEIMAQYPNDDENTKAEADEGRAARIDAVLEKAGLVTVEDKTSYEAALAYSPSGFSVVMARDIDELYTNSYNPEIARAWNGNTDFQICLDFYAIITYITEYYTKDDTGVVKILIDTLKASESKDQKAKEKSDLQDKMKLLMNTWIKNRQMGEAEAVYRLTKEFHFRESDAACVFVQTCLRKDRSKMLKNVTDKPEYKHMPKVKVDNHKDEEYIEDYDINSKYERRPTDNKLLKYLSLSQMVKIYTPSRKPKDDVEANQDKDEEQEENAE